MGFCLVSWVTSTKVEGANSSAAITKDCNESAIHLTLLRMTRQQSSMCTPPQFTDLLHFTSSQSQILELRLSNDNSGGTKWLIKRKWPCGWLWSQSRARNPR